MRDQPPLKKEISPFLGRKGIEDDSLPFEGGFRFLRKREKEPFFSFGKEKGLSGDATTSSPEVSP